MAKSQISQDIAAMGFEEAMKELDEIVRDLESWTTLSKLMSVGRHSKNTVKAN